MWRARGVRFIFERTAWVDGSSHPDLTCYWGPGLPPWGYLPAPAPVCRRVVPAPPPRRPSPLELQRAAAITCSAAGVPPALYISSAAGVCSAASAPAPEPAGVTLWPPELLLPQPSAATATLAGSLASQGFCRLPPYMRHQPDSDFLWTANGTAAQNVEQPPAARPAPPSPAPASPNASVGGALQQQDRAAAAGQHHPRAQAAATVVRQPPAPAQLQHDQCAAQPACPSPRDDATAVARCLPTDACWRAAAAADTCPASASAQCSPAGTGRPHAGPATEQLGAAAAWPAQQGWAAGSLPLCLACALALALAAAWLHDRRRLLHGRQRHKRRAAERVSGLAVCLRHACPLRLGRRAHALPAPCPARPCVHGAYVGSAHHAGPTLSWQPCGPPPAARRWRRSARSCRRSAAGPPPWRTNASTSTRAPASCWTACRASRAAARHCSARPTRWVR